MDLIRENVKSWLMLFAVVLAWASSFIFIKVGLQGVPPITFAVLRFAIASVALLPMLSVIGGVNELRYASHADKLKFVTLGLSGITLFNMLQFVGLSLTTATNGSILLSTNPIFISVLSLIFLHEKIGLRNVIGICLATIGIMVVMTGGRFSATMFSSSTFLGDLLILGSGVCWAIYTVLGKSMFTRYKPMTVTIINMVVGTLLLVVFALITEDFNIVPGISASTWVIILYLAFVCSGLAYILWYESLNRLDASKAGAFLFTIPLFTILIAHFTIGEIVTGPITIGAVLIILGIYLAERD